VCVCGGGGGDLQNLQNRAGLLVLDPVAML